MLKIPFNKPYITGKESEYIAEAIALGHISGNGVFSKKCHAFFEERFHFKKALLTTSCTDALEMAALLTDIQPGDEIIVPSFTFVSTALAFVRQGANMVFCDSRSDHPGMDEEKIETLITEKTKAIVVVHYAGVAVDMDKIMQVATKHKLFVIEDAAQGIDSYFNGKPLGSIGHLGCFSFHETKNLQCGEGGMLAINDEQFSRRSEIIWEKGTNRAEFFRGQVDKYGWVDTGSSFLQSDVLAAFLYAQLMNLDDIQKRRMEIWNFYQDQLVSLSDKGLLQLPVIPGHATNNAHMYYMVCTNLKERSALIKRLRAANISAVFHYQSLHKSEYYSDKHDGRELIQADRYSDCLLRLPFYYELTYEDQQKVVDVIKKFYQQ